MTERTTHHQRRPPDVEAALSSMLWTPYERTPTDSSSEDDDDERLNKRLRKSQCSDDYAALTPLSASCFAVDDLLLPTAIAASGGHPVSLQTNTTTTTATNNSNSIVPFSNLIFSSNSDGDSCCSATSQHSGAATAANYQKNCDTKSYNYRFSYPIHGPTIPSLYNWWASAATAKEPPSYESLYAETASSVALMPVLSGLKATSGNLTSVPDAAQLESDSSNCAHGDDDGDGDGDGNTAVDGVGGANGRLVHSFTDDFISENRLQHVATNDEDIHENNSNHNVTAQAQQHDNLSYQHHAINLTQLASNVCNTNAETQQNNESNNNNNINCNNNCLTSDHNKSRNQQQQQQPCARAYAEVEVADEEEVQDKASKEQVNQPISSVNHTNAALAGTPNTNKTASTAATATSAVNSPSRITTKTAITTNSTTSPLKAHSTRSSDKATIHQRGNNSVSAATALSQAVQTVDTQTPTISSTSTFDEFVSNFKSTAASISCRKSHLESRLRRRCRGSPVASPQLHCSSGNSLTPNNKCLAELERLYAEFRASESVVERNLRDLTYEMRLNVPATGAATTSVADSRRRRDNPLVNITTSSGSVVLTTTSCVEANGIVNYNKDKGSVNSNVAVLTTTPCQRQPSLTIQVNNNNNSTANVAGALPAQAQQLDVLLKQSIVNNNGVSVVNCSYIRNNNNNNTTNNKTNNTESVGIGGGPNASSSVNVNSGSSVPIVFSNSVNSCGDAAANILNNNNHINNNYKYNNNNNNNTHTNNNNDNNINNKNINRNANAAITSEDNSVHIISVNNQASPMNSTHFLTTSSPQSPTITPTTTAPTVSNSITTTPTSTPTRTFTSTECQTDDFTPVAVELRANRACAPQTPALVNREQRRRERRERRQHQQLQPQQFALVSPAHRRHAERHSMPAGPPMSHLHPPHMHHAMPPTATMPAAMSAMLRPMLPDILHSHFPPPYSALPLSAGGGGGSGGGGGGVGQHAVPQPPMPQLMGPPAPPPPHAGPPTGTTILTPVISTVPIPGTTSIVSDGRFTLPVIRRSPSERSGKGCCGQWFAGPPLRALIAVVALGGVACALGGAALGATGLAGPPSSHLTAALLMIGVGVVLVTVSGAAWRMTAPGGPPCLGLGASVDLGRCGRRPCSRGGGAPHGLLYPEFQHRPPPPSYQASMQEYRLRLLLLDRDRQNGVVRGNSPPPTYRSHAGSLLRAPLTTTTRGGGGNSSLGGSEYSLPPSYRSRNGTPATIETAPSGRLLANEDLPESLSNEQLPDYSALQRHQSTDTTPSHASIPKTTTDHTSALGANQVRTSAVMEVEGLHQQHISSEERSSVKVVNEKFNPRVFSNHNNKDNCSAASNKELVTIVTISQADSQPSQRHAGEQIEILAHL